MKEFNDWFALKVLEAVKRFGVCLEVSERIALELILRAAVRSRFERIVAIEPDLHAGIVVVVAAIGIG